MRRLLTLLILAAALALACNTLVPVAITETPVPLPTATPYPTATALPTATPRPTVAPTLAAPATPTDLYISPGDVLIHPEPVLYSGDVVSFEVFAHDGGHKGLSGFPVAVYLGDPAAGKELSQVRAGAYGLGGRLEATFTWVWDTTGLVGAQTLTVVLDPTDEIQIGDEDTANNVLTVPVTLLPRADEPPVEQSAHWLTSESACCVFRYISGTAAERDIVSIEAAADKAITYVEAGMGRELSSKLTFNLINRLLGHGGFAADTVTISYLDRDYAGGGLENVFRHESTHVLDRQMGGARPSVITEGLATYVAGGHFKNEPFAPRAAGLLAQKHYIPLRQLADDFYNSQHETGYLEGAAFIMYLVDTFGWDRFVTLLGAFQPAPKDSAMLDAGLRLTYNKSLDELEADWLVYLRALPPDARWQTDIADTIDYYDTVRRYQQADDPSAYFLTAWIPDIEQAVRRDITADYSRHPAAPENIALETLLGRAGRAINEGDHATARRCLEAVNAVLEAHGDFAADPLAHDYLLLTRLALESGYEPQRIALDGDSAVVTATRLDGSTALTELKLTRTNGIWRLN